MEKELIEQKYREEFFQLHGENDIDSFVSSFKRIEDFEKEIGKSVLYFSEKEIEDMYYSFNSKSVLSLQNTTIKISNYVKFMEGKGYDVKIKNHPIKEFKKFEILTKFVDEGNLFFDESELNAILRLSDNAQDSLILKLIYSGVSHKENMIELRELTKDDVDLEGERIYIKHRDMWIDLDRFAMQLIDRAIAQTYYYSIVSENGVSRKYKLATNNYIFRGTKKGDGMTTYRNLSQRVSRLSSQFGKEDQLTPTNIAFNGQINYYKKLINSGVEDIQARKETLTRFGLQVNGSSLHYIKNRVDRYETQQRIKSNSEQLN